MAETSGRYVALIPGGGWMVYHGDGHRGWSDPVIGWALQPDGVVVALTAAENGTVAGASLESTDGLWHPDSSDPDSLARREHHRSQVGD